MCTARSSLIRFAFIGVACRATGKGSNSNAGKVDQTWSSWSGVQLLDVVAKIEIIYPKQKGIALKARLYSIVINGQMIPLPLCHDS